PLPGMVLSDEKGPAPANRTWDIIVRAHRFYTLVFPGVSLRFWQRTQSVAQGTTLSRAMGIGSPHVAHKPQSSFSSRFKASSTAFRRTESESWSAKKRSFW